MPLGINNPFPTSAGGECKKASKVNLGPILMFSLMVKLISQQQVLSSFIDPRQAFGPDKIIPPSVLANAKVRRFGGFKISARFSRIGHHQTFFLSDTQMLISLPRVSPSSQS